MPTIRQRGDSWQAIVRIKRLGTIVHQESRSFPTEPLARSWAKEVALRIKRDGVPGRALQVQSLGNLIQSYQGRLSGIKPLNRSLDHELSFLSETFKSTPLYGLTSATFVTFAEKRRREGAGPATILHNLSTVRSVLSSSKAMFSLEVNTQAIAEAISTLKRIGLVAQSTKREQRVAEDVVRQLEAEFDRIAGNPSTKIPMATIVRLAVEFPRRRTELCTMLWENLDRRKRTVKLLDTKHPTLVRNEVVPIPPRAMAIIESLPVIDARILPYEPESVSAAFERACARLGIEDVRFHDLRHEGVSRLFEQGLQIPEVAMISGHTSWGTLKRYTHLTPEQVLGKFNADLKEAQKAGSQPA